MKRITKKQARYFCESAYEAKGQFYDWCNANNKAHKNMYGGFDFINPYQLCVEYGVTNFTIEEVDSYNSRGTIPSICGFVRFDEWIDYVKGIVMPEDWNDVRRRIMKDKDTYDRFVEFNKR